MNKNTRSPLLTSAHPLVASFGGVMYFHNYSGGLILLLLDFFTILLIMMFGGGILLEKELTRGNTQEMFSLD